MHAIISDIHGSLTALEAVLDDIQNRAVDHIHCLGDVVGYGPQPSECIQLIIDRNIPCIKGNHDQFAYQEPDMSRLSTMAQASAVWTRDQLSRSEIDWLEALPMTREVEGATLIHASLNTRIEWEYVKDLKNAGDSFDHQTAPLCFIGHTHTPAAYMHQLFSRPLDIYAGVEMNADAQYLINVGSVGQPRDNDPRAAYVLWDVEKSTITLIRVEYPIEKTQKLILAAGLPERLATRLAEGR